MPNTVTIEINAAVKQAQDALQSFFGFFQQQAQRVKNVNEELQAGGRAVNEILAGAGVVLGIEALKSYHEKAKAARVEQAQLEAALRATKQLSPEYVAELQAQRDALKENIGAANGMSTAVQRLLISFEAPRQYLPQLTQLAFDLAAELGTDVTSAATMLGRALIGDDVAFGRLHVTIDRALPKIEQVKSALLQLQGFRGQSRAIYLAEGPELHHLEQTLSAIKRLIGEIYDQFARPFAEGLVRGLEQLKQKLKELNQEYPTLTANMKVIGEKIADNLPWLTLVGAIVLLVNTLGNAYGRIAALVEFAWRVALAPLARIGAQLVAASGEILAGGATLAESLGAVGVAIAAAIGTWKLGKLAGEKIAEFFSEFEIGFANHRWKIGELLEFTWLTVLEDFQKFMGLLKAAGVWLLTGIAQLVGNAVLGVLTLVMEPIFAVLDKLPEKLKPKVRSMYEVFAEFNKAIKSERDKMLAGIKQTTEEAVTPISDAATALVMAVRERDQPHDKHAPVTVAEEGEARMPKPTELLKKEAEAELKEEKSALAQQEQALDLSYERRQITIEQYVAAKKKLLERGEDQDLKPLVDEWKRLKAIAEEMKPGTKEAYENETQRKELLAAISQRTSKTLMEIRALEEHGRKETERQEKESADARIKIAEDTGEKLKAAELKVQQQFKEIREQNQNRMGAAKLSEAQIAAAERLALAQEKVNLTEEARTINETHYQQAVQTTNALLESGQISALDAQKRNNFAASQYLATLKHSLAVLEGIAAANPQLAGIREKVGEIKVKIAETQAAMKPTGFFDTVRFNLNKLRDEWGNVAQNMANWFTGSVQSAVNGVSNAIMGLIDGTQTWGQVFLQVARQIIAGLINVVVQWIAQMTIIAALKKLFGVQDNVMAAQSAAAWAPAAVAASIASFGSAAAIGTAAYMSALFTGTALAAGLSAGAGFAEGGFVGGGERLIRVNERGPEFVIPAHRVNELGLPFLEGLRSGLISASTLRPSIVSPIISQPGLPLQFGGNGAAGSNVSVQPTPVKVAVLNSREELKKLMEGAWGESLIVTHVTKNRAKLGIPT